VQRCGSQSQKKRTFKSLGAQSVYASRSVATFGFTKVGQSGD